MDKKYVNDGIQLLVNSTEIGLNEFTSSFLKDTIEGMVSSLRTDVGPLYEATIEIANIEPENMENAAIELFINDVSIEINEFVSGIMKESVYGMVKALNTEKFGIETIKSINIKIEKWFYETC